MAEAFPVVRQAAPRLFRAADDPAFAFPPPRDAVRQRMLANIVADCEDFAALRPRARIAERLESPHPYHQLYITFYTAIHAGALIEQYSFAARMTGEKRWLDKARQWLRAAAAWEHSDRVEETFYCANRYMQAFAVALDWLGDRLPADEEAAVTECLAALMRRWWPEVDRQRHNPDGGHHAAVDDGHFGVAALALLGRHPDADAWVRAVIDRFRAGIMPHGCAADGSPFDGPTFWAAENLWMLQFTDALRHVTGIDLAAEFPGRLRRPVEYLRPLLPLHGGAAPAKADKGSTLPSHLVMPREHVAPVLLRLAQEAGDRALWEWSLAEPRLGRAYHYGVGVKGTPYECVLTMGPYAYLFYDPAAFRGRGFRGRGRGLSGQAGGQQRGSVGLTAKSSSAVAVLRAGSAEDRLVAAVWQFVGEVGSGLGRLEAVWDSRPLLKTFGCAETAPYAGGSMPWVGGQCEMVFKLGELRRGRRADHLAVGSARVEQDYWLLKDGTPGLLIALRRRPRGLTLLREGGEAFARLSGEDYLQYPGEPYFHADAGELRLRARVRAMPAAGQPAVLFNVGVGVPGGGVGGLVVSSLALSLIDDRLRWASRSNRSHEATAELDAAAMAAGGWHDITARWGGFNRRNRQPFIELTLDGRTARMDDPAVFGELGTDSQGMASRSTPRPYRLTPHSVLALGAGVLLPGTGCACDLRRAELKCPGRQVLRLDFAEGLGPETGSGPMAWWFHPTALASVGKGRAILKAGPSRVQVRGLPPYGARLTAEEVPWVTAGFAASSLRYLQPPAEQQRLWATAQDPDLLLLLLTDAEAKVATKPANDGLELSLDGRTYRLTIRPRGEVTLR